MDIATIIGVLLGLVVVVGAIAVGTGGPPLAGFIFDNTGSYSLVLVIFLITYVLSTVTIYFTWGKTPGPFILTRRK